MGEGLGVKGLGFRVWGVSVCKAVHEGEIPMTCL